MTMEAFFAPTSVAVVGASREKGKVGYEILAALIKNQWSRKRAARELGMDRTTLWRKMKRMGLDHTTPPDKNTEGPKETG